MKQIDWTKSMRQTFEYYEVNPNTWKDERRINSILSSTIERDAEADTLGSASLDVVDVVGESYIRIYMNIVQNGENFRIPLGTYLLQTPSSSFDGVVRTTNIDAYTPLIELKENPMPLGFALMKDQDALSSAYKIIKDGCRAPVAKPSNIFNLRQNFISNIDDNKLKFTKDLLMTAKYKLDMDENGKIYFAPLQRIDELQPIWTFNDDNSSILQPKISLKHDLYGVPNVIEIVVSTGSKTLYSRVVNDDPTSPTSTVRRGREILYRETTPNISGIPTQEELDLYAENLLKTLSSVSYTVTFTHAYCPVRVGDAIRLNYKSADLFDIKAVIINQSIKCEPGVQVSTTAVFTKKLWK